MKNEVLVRVENIQQNLKMIDNIFKCMKTYWVGKNSDAIQELYCGLQQDICKATDYLEYIIDNVVSEEIVKLPRDIL